MNFEHYCHHDDCQNWGAFGEKLPDVPEADFPTRWYCGAHLPPDYYTDERTIRLREIYKNGELANEPLPLSKQVGCQGRLL